MNREFKPGDELATLSKIFQNITSSPEFYFAEGDFLRRLEHVCYYQLGNFRYPAKLLIAQLFTKLGEKFHISIAVQDIQIKVAIAPVYKLPVEAAIMAQDTNHVIGPVEEILAEDVKNISEKDLAAAIEKTLLSLQDFKPHQQGEILVSSPHWCQAKYLLEAVIYHFEGQELTREELVRTVMAECFQRCDSLKVKKLAIETLGTEYRVLTHHTFVQILHETLLQSAGRLLSLHELIIAVRDEAEAQSLKQAFKDILNIKIP